MRSSSARRPWSWAAWRVDLHTPDTCGKEQRHDAPHDPRRLASVRRRPDPYLTRPSQTP